MGTGFFRWMVVDWFELCTRQVGLALCALLMLQVCKFTISCELSSFILYIACEINVVKILREASLVVINAMSMFRLIS
jgi:hypothetical protein